MTDRYEEQVIKPGDQASRYAKDVGFKTHDYNSAACVFALEPGNFRGKVGVSYRPPLLKKMLKNFDELEIPRTDEWELIELIQNDGCGGKPQFASLVNSIEAYRRIGHDLVAMMADDLAGAYPTIAVNEINCKNINETNLPFFQAVMDGYLDALALAGMINVTGETAILRNQLTAFCDDSVNDDLIFTWGGTCRGLLHRRQSLHGRFISEELPIVGFFENGYRCNGGGLLTNIALNYYGGVDKIRNSDEAMTFIDDLTTPSVIHCKMLAEAMGWDTEAATYSDPLIDILAVANITGGGLQKLKEALGEGTGAHLDNMPVPPKVLLQAQEMSFADQVPDDLRLTDEKCHTNLHGGCGMIAVVSDPSEAGKLIDLAKRYKINADIIGQTTKGPDAEISVKSEFRMNTGKTIFPLRK